MNLRWVWRPRLKRWQLVSDGKRRRVVKGKTFSASRRVEAIIDLRPDGSWLVSFYNYHPTTHQWVMDHTTRSFIDIEEAKAVTLMEVSLKGST